MKKINTTELIRGVQEKDLVPAKFVQPVVMELMRQIQEHLLNNNAVDLYRIGKLFPHQMNERVVYSPMIKGDAKRKVVAPHKVLRIDAHDGFKAKIWGI